MYIYIYIYTHIRMYMSMYRIAQKHKLSISQLLNRTRPRVLASLPSCEGGLSSLLLSLLLLLLSWLVLVLVVVVVVVVEVVVVVVVVVVSSLSLLLLLRLLSCEGGGLGGDTPNLPAKTTPAKIRWLKLCGKFQNPARSLTSLKIQFAEIEILLESNPPKPIILV